jgi:outer membrane protein assembly factor BamA
LHSITGRICAVLILRSFLSLVLILNAALAQPQTNRKPTPKPAPADHKLVSIKVTGSQHYTPEEIIAASGLKIGDAATDDDFKKATEELGKSGMFTNVSYSYAYSPAGTKLDFQVSDADKLVPARFENFVWFSDADLIAKIHEREPLFKGDVPVGGGLADRISDALQELLLQHNLSAHATYIREGASHDGPIDAIDFKAENINIHIRNVSFPSAPPDQQADLTEAAQKLEDRDYLRSDVNAYIKSALLPVYLKHGFLKVAFAEPQAKVVHEDQDETQVDVDLASTPGLQYKVSGFTWEGNTTFPADKLQPLIHLQPTQTANAVQLQSDLDAVHKLYGTRGYMTASVKSEPVFDDGSRSVAYKLQVHEGDLFHMGDLEINGLDVKTADRLREAWNLKPSDAYDSSYPKRFIDQAWKMLPPKTNFTVSLHEGVNEKEKTVDVSLRYGIKPN